MPVAQAARTRNDHLYEDCEDPDCPRFPCRVYKEGIEVGYRRGYDEGYGDGYRDGYSAGWASGWAAGFAAGFAAAGGR